MKKIVAAWRKARQGVFTHRGSLQNLNLDLWVEKLFGQLSFIF
jgi:hypothetical protein